MADEKCDHQWSMINVKNGYLVTEGCAHCGARISFFSLEDVPPKDSYTEGPHTWKYLGSSQAVRFDLKCGKCGEVVELKNVVGLMLCTNCDPECNAGSLANLVGKEKTWVYVALCADTTHKGGKCVSDEETRALTEYFNSRITTPGKKVLFVPCKFIRKIDTCRGEIIADTGLTSIY